MKINPIDKKIYKKGYNNTLIYKNEEEFNGSTSGIYIDYEKNLLKFKNDKTSNKYCWLQVDIPSFYATDEFYISYDVRNCTGDDFFISFEQGDTYYRKSAYKNSNSEWQRHRTKIIIDKIEKNNISNRYIVSLGNTKNYQFSAELRNIQIEFKSSKNCEYNVLLPNNNIYNIFNGDDVILSSPENQPCYFLGKLSKSKWYSIKLMHYTQSMTNIHSISYWTSLEYTQSFLSGKNADHIEIYTVDKATYYDVYVKIIRTSRANEFTFIFTPDSGKDNCVPIDVNDKVELPVEAQKITPKMYSTLPQYNKTYDNRGWIKYPDGRLEQWGMIVGTNLTNYTVTLPVAFSQDRFVVVATPVMRDLDTAPLSQFSVDIKNNTSFDIRSRRSGTIPTLDYANWIAIGYWK